MHILVTGAAGFIGYHLSRRLLKMGHTVVGLDNLSDYYAVQLKKDRLALLDREPGFQFVHIDLADATGVAGVFEAHPFACVINLAAQPSVRWYSPNAPEVYVKSNIVGFLHVLEGCRYHEVKHLVFASSSSVYGLNTRIPFDVHQNVDHPISLYAATKKSDELLAHTYSYLYGIPCTGLRFFTVYGPWGRPDMAAFLFVRAILEGQTLKVHNHGKMRRSYTYVDDIVEGLVRTMERIPKPDPNWSGDQPDPASSSAPYKLYNIGNSTSVELGRFISILEELLGREAQKEYLPSQPGEVPDTYADVEDLARDVGYAPSTPLEEGLAQFVAWYRDYYGV